MFLIFGLPFMMSYIWIVSGISSIYDSGVLVNALATYILIVIYLSMVVIVVVTLKNI